MLDCSIMPVFSHFTGITSKRSYLLIQIREVKPVNILISSTYEDLKEERAGAIAIIERIGHAVAMERFVASPDVPEELCRRELSRCNAVVLIIGYRYGSLVPELGISVTEMEYNLAKELSLPVFVFLKDGWHTVEKDAKLAQKHLDFKKRVENERYRRTFSSVEQLQLEIALAIRNYEIREGQLAAGASVFVAAENFFAPFLRPGRLFNHRHPLVGREKTLQELDAFIKSNAVVALLLGRGGIGKSRVLCEWGRQFADKWPGYRLLFLQEEVELNSDALAQLPTAPCVVVVDDAHRHNDIGLLLKAAQNRKQPLKVVLSLRPYGCDNVDAVFVRTGIAQSEVFKISELTELEKEDLLKLAASILPQEKQIYAELLVSLAKDSPLVLTVGAELLAREEISPRLIAETEEFRREVLERFTDITTGSVVNDLIEPRVCRILLALIAATSPVRPENRYWVTKAAGFLDIDAPVLLSALGRLEKAGILLRRGRIVRITPDVLSDYILHSACINAVGRPTLFADQVFHAFADTHGANILRHLAELDWRLGRASSINIMDGIWKFLEDKLRTGTMDVCFNILNQLEEAAYFAPGPVLHLLEVARHINPLPGPLDKLVSTNWRKYFNRTAPKIIKNITYNLEYLPYCCELLWSMGRDDPRPINSYTEHPVRILTDLASYNYYKPVAFHRVLLQQAERWLQEPGAFEHAYSPLVILDALLAKEGHDVKSAGPNFVLRSFPVSYEHTRDIRLQALELLRQIGLSDNIKVVLEGMRSLSEAFRPPFGIYGRRVTEEEKRQWDEQRFKVLEILKQAAEKQSHPIIHVKLYADINSKMFFGHLTEKEKAAAQEIKANIANNFEFRITRALWNSYDIWDRKLDFKEREKEITIEVQSVAKEWADRIAHSEAGYYDLNRRLQELQDSGVSPNAGYFIAQLVEQTPAMTEQWTGMLLLEPDAPLAAYLHLILSSLRRRNPRCFSALVQRILDNQIISHYQTLASGYAYQGWTEDFQQGELNVLSQLIKSNDEVVLKNVLFAIQRLGKQWHSKKIELLMEINLSNNPGVTNDFCAVVDGKNGGSLKELEVEQLEEILGKLLPVPELGGYFTKQFLQQTSQIMPGRIVNFILKRIDLYKSQPGEKYKPLPFDGLDIYPHDFELTIRERKIYIESLYEIMERACHSEGAAKFWLPILFRSATRLTGLGLELLDRWLNSGQPDKIKAAALLLREAGPDFVFAQKNKVCRWLETVSKIDLESYEHLCGDLFQAAVAGIRSGPAGQPKPQDVNLRDNALKVLDELTPHTPTWRFYNALLIHAEDNIRDDMLREQEMED